MSASYSRCGRSVMCGITVCSLVLTNSVVIGQSKKERASNEKETKMIDDIANRNAPPKKVQGDGPTIPLFPKDYDWKEQARVVEALGRLEKESYAELWEELVQKSDDNRYSLTIRDKSSDAPYNESVGVFCSELAFWQLTGVFLRHLPDNPTPGKNGRSIRLTIVPRSSLKKWREERKNKSLYELQIEIGELMIKELAKVKTATEEEKNKAHKKIEAEIATLKKSKKPIMLKTRTSAFDALYDSKEAVRFRKRLGIGK